MRIESLDLLAFGPFAGQRLAFSGEGRRIHLVYGPNEAGKSSALRALRDALFGIPHTSRDNFRHDYQALRIGLALRGADGSSFAAIRKKGNRNTLLHPDTEEPVADALLGRLLSGITRDTYERMFGIDHAMLAAGGRELAAMQGQVGESLFTAATGVSCLRTLEQDLETESASLYLPKGQRALNKALAEYADLKKRLRSEQLSSRDYAAKHAALKDVDTRLGELTREIGSASAEANRHRRMKDSLPLLAQRRDAAAELEPHGATRLLRQDFGKDARRAIEAFTRADEQLATARQGLEDVDRLLAECPPPAVPKELWHLASDLADKIGAHRKALADLVTLRRNADARQQEVESHFRRLRPPVAVETYARLRIDAPTYARIQEIGSQLTAKRALREKALGEQKKARQACRDAERALATAPLPLDTAALQAAIDHAGSRGDSDSMIRRLEKESKEKLSAIEADLAAAGRWSGRPEAIATLPFPAPATIARHESRLSQAAAAVSRARQTLSDLETRMRRVGDELDTLVAAEGELPTEADVHASRKHRDELWSAIRDSWLHGDAPHPAAEAPVAERPGIGSAYERRVREADEVADRVRLEHARVAQRARLGSEKECLTRDIAGARSDVDDAVRHADEVGREWDALWDALAVTPGDPAEMREWLTGIRDARTALATASATRDELDELVAFTRAARERLIARIGEIDADRTDFPESLAGVVAVGRAVIAEQASRREVRTGLASTVASATRQERDSTESLDDLSGPLDTLEAEWRAAVALIDVPDGAPLAEVNAIVTARNDAYALAHELHGPEGQFRRIDHIGQDLERFAAEVARAAEQMGRPATGIAAGNAADVAGEIVESIQDSKLAHERINDARSRRQTALAKVRDKDSDLGAAKAALASLMAEAGTDSAEELIARFDASEKRREIEKRRDGIESSLRSLAADTPIDAWAAEASDSSVDALAGRLAELDERIRQLDENRQRLATEKGRLTNELNQFGTGDAAVTIASRMEAELANIDSLAREYAQLRVSAVVLRRAIERFGDQNKGELLGKAGEFFATLTRGSFTGLVVDYDDDRPLIAGRRAGTAAPLRVEAMSEGTADQLYLALRLAYLSSWVDKHEPLPLILDDVLMTFDDDRAAAAMNAFASLASKTQIILFTHHRHVVDLARSRLPASSLDVLELNA